MKHADSFLTEYLANKPADVETKVKNEDWKDNMSRRFRRNMTKAFEKLDSLPDKCILPCLSALQQSFIACKDFMRPTKMSGRS